MPSGHTFLITSGDTSISDISRNHDHSIGQRLSLSNSSSSINNLANSTPRQQNLQRTLTVHLYKRIEEKVTNINCTAEELCTSLLRKYFPKVGPAALNLFALAVIDPKRSIKCVWKSPTTDVKELQQQLHSSLSAKLYLRIRYLPVNEKIDLELLQDLGDDVILYLYYQCKEDFVNDRLKVVFGSRKPLTSAKSRGLAVLDQLITGRDNGKDIKSIIEDMKLKNVLPPGELPAFWKFWKLINLKKHMKSHLTRFDETYPKESTRLEELMIGYVKDILKEVMEYSIEQYEATVYNTTREATTVQIVVDVHHHPTGIRINDDFFCKIEDLSCVSCTPCYDKRTWRVHLDRANGFPGVFEFQDEDVAESFMSGLDGYYRLLKDYYFSLCKKMEPPSLKALKSIRSFGPIKTNYAVEKLKKKMDEQEYYLYHQDIWSFNTFIVVYCKYGQAKIKKMKVKDGKYHLEGSPNNVFDDPAKLIKCSLEQDIPVNLTRLRPSNEEACGVLQCLFMDDKSLTADDSADDSYSGKKNEPVVYQPSALKLKEMMDNGHFTEVFKAELKSDREEKVVAVKRLRTNKVNPIQLYRSIEPFQKSNRQLMAFNDTKFFVGMHGICLTTPLTLILDLAPYGSLSQFFRKRQPQQPICLHHLLFTADQVAQGLYYLEDHNLYHGNICCNNILVYKYEVNELSVKLADPGMTELYEDLDLTHPVNRRRIPWLAPELCNTAKNKIDKDKASIKSDIYAFGATMLEMFGQGLNPVDCPPLNRNNTDQIVKFFKEGKRSELPLPDDLVTAGKGEKLGLHVEATKENNEDETGDRQTGQTNSQDKHYKSGANYCKEEIKILIRKCLMGNQEERLSAKEIVRDLIALGYGSNYHIYDSVPYGDFSTSEQMFSSSDTNFPVPSTPETVPDLTGSLHSDGVRNIITSTVTPDRERAVQPVPEINPTSVQGNILSKTPQVSLPAIEVNPWRRPLPQPEFSPIDQLKYLIDSNKLDFSERKTLGQGHYGEVKKGILTINYNRNKQQVVIAAKCLKGEFRSVLDDQEFRREAIIMAQLEHKNIVKFYGISNDKIIMEYVEEGAMSLYVRKRRKESNFLGTEQLVKIIRDVAKGMQHLAEKRIIHSDLAGRNVLLTSDLMAKIADFGLARNLEKNKDYYKRSREKELPACWCAPEGLSHQRFTTKGDIWSYGVVVWEAFTHGHRPYADKNFKFKTDGFIMLQKGKRLDLPANCPPEIKEMVLDCWQFEPEDRPEFDELERTCNDFLSTLEENEIASPDSDTTNTTAALPMHNQNVTSEVKSHQNGVLQQVVTNTVQSNGQHGQNVPSVISGSPVGILNTQSALSTTAQNNGWHGQNGSLVGTLNMQSALSTTAQNNGQLGQNVQPVITGSPVGTLNTQSAVRHIANQGNCIVNHVQIPSPSVNPLLPLVSPVTDPKLQGEGHVIQKTAGDVGCWTEANNNIVQRQLPQLPDIKYIIRSCDIKVSNTVLGKGEFGTVLKATYEGKDVAVKKIDTEHRKEMATQEFLEEAKILSELPTHTNIVTFIGFNMNESMIVMEFVKLGSLHQYLTNAKNKRNMVQPEILMKMIADVATGMEFLSEKRVIHCDLKCSNILLTEDLTAKISDFGLSKMLNANKDYYRRINKKICLLNSAPEILQQKKFSSKSDVWSFGTVMWETFEHGAVPVLYHHSKGIEDIDLGLQVSAIINGKQLPKPENCDEETYRLMRCCWELDPGSRIDFKEVLKQCVSLLENYRSQSAVNEPL